MRADVFVALALPALPGIFVTSRLLLVPTPDARARAHEQCVIAANVRYGVFPKEQSGWRVNPSILA